MRTMQVVIMGDMASLLGRRASTKVELGSDEKEAVAKRIEQLLKDAGLVEDNLLGVGAQRRNGTSQFIYVAAPAVQAFKPIPQAQSDQIVSIIEAAFPQLTTPDFCCGFVKSEEVPYSFLKLHAHLPATEGATKGNEAFNMILGAVVSMMTGAQDGSDVTERLSPQQLQAATQGIYTLLADAQANNNGTITVSAGRQEADCGAEFSVIGDKWDNFSPEIQAEIVALLDGIIGEPEVQFNFYAKWKDGELADSEFVRVVKPAPEPEDM